MRSSDIILILVAILCPPIAVLMVAGCGCDFLISVLLTVLGYIPGHLHAFYLIYLKMAAEEQIADYEAARGQYAPIHQGPPQQSHTYAPLGHQTDSAPNVAGGQTSEPGPVTHTQEPSGPPPSYGATMDVKKP